MTLGDILKEYRDSHDISMDEFSKRSNLSKGYISMLENNINPRNSKPISPTLPTIKKVADGMSIDMDSLLKMMDKSQSVSISNIHKSKSVRIPVLGNVPAGIPIEAVEDIIDYEEIDSITATKGEYFGLKVKGSSMEPRICEGDVLIVKRQDDCESGDVAIIMVNGNDATVKRLMKYEDGIRLIPNNPAFEPMYFTNEDINTKPVKVIGKVIENRQKY